MQGLTYLKDQGFR